MLILYFMHSFLSMKFICFDLKFLHGLGERVRLYYFLLYFDGLVISLVGFAYALSKDQIDSLEISGAVFTIFIANS